MRYSKCDKCEYKVPQVIEKVIKGKRITLCFGCARKEGWFDPDMEQLKFDV